MRVSESVALQAFEHLRQHAGDHGEVHQHARVTRRPTHDTTCRREEEDRGTAAPNASQVIEVVFPGTHVMNNAIIDSRLHSRSATHDVRLLILSLSKN